MNAVSEPSLNQTSRWNKVTVALLSALLLVVSVLHYATPKPWVHFHTLYREVYFLIVIAAAYLGGLKPGLITAGVISAIYAPHVWMTWKAQPGVNVGNLFQIFLYFLSAATLGVLRDREKRRLTELQHAWSMASLGRAALALSAEIHDLLRMAREILRKEYVADPTRKDLQKIMKKLNVLDQSLAHFDPSALEEPQNFIDLDSVLEARLPQLRSLAAERQINLRFDLRGAGSLVYGRKEDLLWVAEQLIRNAAEASSPGMTIRVETHSDREGYHYDSAGRRTGHCGRESFQGVHSVLFHQTKRDGTGSFRVQEDRFGSRRQHRCGKPCRAGNDVPRGSPSGLRRTKGSFRTIPNLTAPEDTTMARRIAHRFLWILILLTALPLGIMGAATYGMARRALIGTALMHMETIAEDHKNHLDFWYRERLQDLASLTALPRVREFCRHCATKTCPLDAHRSLIDIRSVLLPSRERFPITTPLFSRRPTDGAS